MNLNIYLAVAGFLLLLCVFANKLSDRFGIPSLLLFLALGMLAGIDGPGHISFQDSRLTNYIGTVALIFILFNGGLLTNWTAVKPEIGRGSLLATVGVALTALFLFLGAYWLIGLPFSVALLLSVIVSSTDAPAVFSAMRTSRINLRPRLKSILEFESAGNDPMAVFLSLAAIACLSTPGINMWSLAGFFLKQVVIGLLFGLALGRLSVYLLQNYRLPYPGLYPVFGISIAFLIYSLTQLAGGSGYLSVYIGGIIIGNSAFLYRRHLLRFNDSLAWIMQISMFLILGLLVNPHELSEVMPAGFACTLFLIFVARPAAVFICLFKSDYPLKDRILIGWAGLKGAVPIILATYPLIYRLPGAQYLFNLIFFLVIISVLFQGKTLPLLADRLNLGNTSSGKRADE